jgi:hypothetical protein
LFDESMAIVRQATLTNLQAQPDDLAPAARVKIGERLPRSRTGWPSRGGLQRPRWFGEGAIFDLVVSGGVGLTPCGVMPADVAVAGEKIAAIGAPESRPRG